MNRYFVRIFNKATGEVWEQERVAKTPGIALSGLMRKFKCCLNEDERREARFSIIVEQIAE